MRFTELDVEPVLQAAVEKLGFEECTPIQESTIPKILMGQDIAGLAQTGTGKTAAFLLPLMDRILKSEKELEKPERAFKDWKKNQFVLVLVPTRELADQVYDNFKKLKGESKLQGVAIFGGVSYDKQKEALQKGVEFVIATPGRLIDLYKSHLVDLRQVRAVVFDEADRMFDMGFKEDMKYILQRIPRERQFLVYSATLNFDVLNVAYQFGSDPIECNVSKDQPKADNVVDEIFHIGHEEKPKYLLSLMNINKPRQAIIFSNFKMNVGRITTFLNSNGLGAVGISSLLTQAQRNRVMEQFRGKSDQNIMVATDVAARGLDIKGVDMVINYELPDDPENYVHRIGRTGRAGDKGKAFSLVSDRDVDALARIEDYLKHKIGIGWLENDQIIEDFKEFPRESREVRRPAKKKEAERGTKRRASSDNRRGKDSKKRTSEKPSSAPQRRKRKDSSVSASSNSASAGGEKGTHRDRKTGRHKSRPERREGANQPYKGGRRSNDQKLSSKRRSKKTNARRVPARPEKASSISGKIGSFFKKLFS